MTTLIRPRLTEYHGIPVAQADLDFAVPFFDEDVPLYLDPFLLWRSPSQQDQALHTALVNAFNHLGHLAESGGEGAAIDTLVRASECDEVGLGSSASRSGKRIGVPKAREILGLFSAIPSYRTHGFRHFEELQFYVDGISKDRISDIACTFLKSFLIDFTIDQCERLGIPTEEQAIHDVYDYRRHHLVAQEDVALPKNPVDQKPLLFVPKRWLRFTPWINYENYFRDYCPQDDIAHEGEMLDRVRVLAFNRSNYGVVESYITERERQFEDCHSDPLFSQIPVVSAKRQLAKLTKINTGTEGQADKRYEDVIGKLLPSVLYPYLDFAATQSRNESGIQIRDLIFYNTQTDPFLHDLYTEYQARQLVFEVKNVRAVEREHLNQLNRYMTESLGKFGVLVTRHELPKARRQNAIDLWSGQRRCIITLTDVDIAQMVELFESGQRRPLDVLKKKYVEFQRLCPA